MVAFRLAFFAVRGFFATSTPPWEKTKAIGDGDGNDHDDGLSKNDDDDDAASGAPSDLAARALMREPISVVATYY